MQLFQIIKASGCVHVRESLEQAQLTVLFVSNGCKRDAVNIEWEFKECIVFVRSRWRLRVDVRKEI